MTDCNSQRVGFVRRRRLVLESEDHADHPLHLLLVRSSVPANGLLDPRRRVLGALDTRRGCRDQRGAPRLTDEERNPRIRTDKRLLERHRVRLVLGYELSDVVENRPEPCFRSLTR